MKQNDELFEKKLEQMLNQPAPRAGFESALWQKIEAEAARHAVAQKSTVSNGWLSKISGGFRPLRLAAALSGLLIVCALGMTLTPQGQAFARQLLQFFTRSETDTLPVPLEETTPLPPMQWGQLSVFDERMINPAAADSLYYCEASGGKVCSVSDARQALNGQLMELGMIPAGYFLSAIEGRDGYATISYSSSNRDRLLLLVQHPADKIPEETVFKVGSSATVEPVTVHGGEAEYVRGTFSYQDGDQEAVWSEETAQQTVRWQQDGLRFSLINSGEQLSRAELIRVAESVTDQPVTIAEPPVKAEKRGWEMMQEIYPDSLTEVSVSAGFTPWLPAEMPVSLPLLGAVFEKKNQMVTVFFLDISQGNMDMSTSGLQLKQRLTRESESSLAGSFRIAAEIDDPAEMADSVPAAEVITLPGGQSAQYVAGTWTETGDGWYWNDTGGFISRLRWQMDGRDFELSAFGTQLTKDDLARIAAGVNANGLPEPPVSANPALIEKVEQAAGFRLLLPRALPAQFRLETVQFDDYLGVASAVYTAESTDKGGYSRFTLKEEDNAVTPVELAAFSTAGIQDSYSEKPRSAMVLTSQVLTIKETEGRYVEGNWHQQGTIWVWDPSAKLSRLRWQTQEYSLELSCAAAGTGVRDLLRSVAAEIR